MTVRNRRRSALLGLAVLALAAVVVPGLPSGDTEDPVAAPVASRQATPAPVTGEPLVARALDVALLPDGGRDGAPRLLTVRYGRPPARSILTVLERADGRWSPRAEVEYRPPTLARTGTPWLIPIDERRFVIVSVAPDDRKTWLALVTWTGEELKVGSIAWVAGTADAAGSPDVDGDGARELVLVEARTRRSGPTCQGSRLTVVDVPTMGVAAVVPVVNMRLSAATVGPLDDVPGDELVAAAYANCPAGPVSPNRLRLVAIRIADGRVQASEEIAAADDLIAWSGRPSLVDVDGDERSEVLIGGPRGLLILEPARGWRATEVSGARGVLLGARPRSPGADVATFSEEAGVRVVRLERGDAGWTALDRLAVGADEIGSAGLEAAGLDVQTTAIRSGGGGWVVDSGTCPTLFVPGAIVPCVATGRPAPGPAWLATRPLATLADGTLVVAQTDGWGVTPGRPVPPTPVAIEQHGTRWRRGPSERFSIVEVPPAAARAAVRSPAPGTAVASSRAPRAVVSAAPGMRIVVSLRAGGSEVRPSSTLPGLLAETPRKGTSLHLVRIPASGEIEIKLPEPRDGVAPQWRVEMAAVGPVGDVSPITSTSVEVDTVGPGVRLDDAFVRPPWPMADSLTGRTEPGVTVSDGQRSVTAGPDGRFSLEAHLAPWPQRIELRATDAAGNATLAVADVVGGADLRRLPWMPILVVTVLAGAAFGGRVVRGRTPPERDPDAPVIEELAAPVIEELTARRLR